MTDRPVPKPPSEAPATAGPDGPPDAPGTESQPEPASTTRAREDEALDRLLAKAQRPPTMSAAARTRVAAQLLAAAEPATRRRGTLALLWHRRRTITTAASSLALAAAVVLVVIWTQHGSVAIHRNDGVGPRAIKLADGTTVVLDEGAEIAAAGPRELELRRGRVLLDVAKAARPLVIASRQGRAVALGTRVELESTLEETRAAVIRGEVRLEGAAGNEVLHAGEQGHVRSGEAPTRGSAPRLSYVTGWAREAMGHRAELVDEPVRRGALVARAPGWDREWPLPLRELHVDVHVEDGVVRTTIDQTFFNRVNQRLEGQYSFPLPPDAAVSRLAMYVDGRLVEGGIVERQRGREIYESIVYLRRDPALLEWMAGNTFRIRIFPLEARTEKRILLSYTQPLERLYDTYRLAVPIPEVDEAVRHVAFDVRIKGGGYDIRSQSHPVAIEQDGADQVAQFRADDHVIGDDLVLSLRAKQPPTDEVVRTVEGDDQYLLARVMPKLPDAAEPVRRRRWVVLVDTSASRSPLELRAQAFLLRRLVAEADEEDAITVAAFDTAVRRWSAGWTAVRDVDPVMLDRFVETELSEPLGDTDFEGALRAGLGWLSGSGARAGSSPSTDSEPTIAYLGDGVATGGARTIPPLAKLVAGKATFVGIAVGPSLDASLLQALADETGGLFAQWDTGDDLGWKLYDLVAALRTPRLVSLSARLVGADSEAPLEGVRLYVASRQLAGGEAATVVGRLPQRERPRKLVLEGKLGNEPWSQEVSLEHPPQQAGYLPRLFARRHIEALVREGAAAHEEEITRLGMAEFLVTPFTSLIVLETDAMYRQFDVSRPAAARWAPYDAPARIPVKAEPLGAEPLVLAPGGQALLLRTPIPFAEPRDVGWGGSGSSLELSGFGVIGASNAALAVRSRRVGLGLRGTGFGGAGTGTGQGFGSGHGRLGRSAVAKGASGPVGPRVVVTTGALRREQDAVDWMAAPRFGADPRSQSAATATASPGEAVDIPMLVPDAQRHEAAEGPASSTDTQVAPGLPSVSFAAVVDHVPPSITRRGRFDTRVAYWAVAFAGSRDPRLDDLTEFVPALLGDALDADQDALLAAVADGVAGSIAPDAQELLTEAAAARRAMRHSYQRDLSSPAAGPVTVETDQRGRVELRRRTETGLVERMVYADGELVTFYTELRLAVRRAAVPGGPALLARLAPYVLPTTPAELRGYDVSKTGERSLRLTPLGKSTTAGRSAETLEVDLDDQLRVANLRRARPGVPPSETVLTWQGNKLERVRVDGVVFRVDSEPPGKADFDVKVPDQWAAVEMPLREPSHGQTASAAAEVGSASWRAAQQQLLATYAALGDERRLFEVLGAIRERAPLRRGEIALASRSLHLAADRDGLNGLLEGLDEQTEKDRVAAFVRVTWASRHGERLREGFDDLAADRPQSLVGMLAGYRALLETIESGRLPSALEQYQRWVDRGAYPPLRFVAVHAMTNRWRWQEPKKLIALWDDLAADATLQVLALLAGANLAAEHAYDEELRLDPAGRYGRAFDAAAKRGQYPLVDGEVERAFRYGVGGQARWRLFWTSWRSKLLGAKDPEALLSLGRSMLQLGYDAEYGLVASKLRAIDGAGSDVVTDAVRLLVELGRAGDARRLLEGELPPAGAPPGPRSAELLLLASTVAEQEGQLAEAARYFERAMGAVSQALPLTTVRDWYRRLFDLQVRAGRAMDQGEGERTKSALQTAARWRLLDPDNSEIDRLCAGLLYAEGEPQRARRHLASIIDRHPAEGSALAEVADALETQGRLDEAVALWQRASEVEPTDPTWLLREAQAELALGQRAAALPLLDRIAGGSWQDRFENVKRQAVELRRWSGG